MVARNTREQVRRVDSPAAAPLLITDGALVTADAVWAWVAVPIASTFLAEEDDLDQVTVTTARALAAVLPPGVDWHLKVLPAPHTGQAYRASWASFDSVRSPAAEQYIDLGAHRIDLSAAAGAYRRKVVLLGIRCPETDSEPSATTATGLLTRLTGGASPGKQRRRAADRLAARNVKPPTVTPVSVAWRVPCREWPRSAAPSWSPGWAGRPLPDRGGVQVLHRAGATGIGDREHRPQGPTDE